MSRKVSVAKLGKIRQLAVGAVEKSIPGARLLMHAELDAETVLDLLDRYEKLEDLERCNAFSPQGDARVEGPQGEIYRCGLWPDHDGPHVNAHGVEWRQ